MPGLLMTGLFESTFCATPLPTALPGARDSTSKPASASEHIAPVVRTHTYGLAQRQSRARGTWGIFEVEVSCMSSRQ